MDSLNNREIAVALWIIVAIICIFSSSKWESVRSSVSGLLSAFFVKQIISVQIIMLGYVGLEVFLLHRAGLWNVGQIKNTIFWVCSVGLLSIFKLESIKRDKNYFRNLALSSLKVHAIVQFVVGIYAFSLWIELLVVPIVVLIGLMSAVAGTEDRYSQVKRIFDYILIMFSLATIANALYMICSNLGDFAKESTIYDFIVPPLLTVFYIPFLYMFFVYTVYESAFIRLNFFIKDEKVRIVAKLYSVLFFNCRVAQLERWLRHISIDKIGSHRELVSSFKHISKMNRLENSVCDVPISEGWSPYIAKDYLANEGFITGYYNKSYGNEWSASSPMIELGSELLPDNIAYYIEGVEGVAKKLKLNLNINGLSSVLISRKRFMETAEVLIQKSLNMNMTDATKQALLAGESHCEFYGDKAVSVAVNLWPGHKCGGHDLKFTVAND